MIFQLRRVLIVSRLSYQIYRAKRRQRRLRKNNGTMVKPESCADRCILVNQQLMNEVSVLSHSCRLASRREASDNQAFSSRWGRWPLAGRTTGTVNPGVVSVSRYLQVGVEAIIPMDAHSGRDVGARAQAHLYLPAIFPDFYAKPVFGD